MLIRADSGGGTHDFLTWLTRPSRRLHYSVGMVITAAIEDAIGKIPAKAWTPAYDAGGIQRPGAWVAELTGVLDLAGWPRGMRVIARKERPHPGAQLRITDIDGHRVTCFATSTKGGQLADLELRHRRRARCEDRSAAPRTPACGTCRCTASPRTRSGPRSSPWPATCSPGLQCSPSTGPARRWEPKRLRLRLFSAAGRLVRGSRRLRLRLSAGWPWAPDITTAISRLDALSPG